MSQEKAQLIAPQGHFTVPGLNVAGVVTASSFSGNCTGTASSIAKGTNVVVGVMTASSFVGDVTGNVTGIGSNTDNLDVGIVTATSFAGNFTGIGSGLTGTPNVVAGVVTATKFVGNTPGTVSKLADGTNINVGVITATKFVGNTPGLAGGISAAQNINVGVLTATGGLYGDGSGLTGAGSTAFIRQSVTASVSGTINLNLGNIVYLTHDANVTISFSNVSTATNVTIIRTISNNTITWPAAVKWTGGSAPTLSGDSANTRFAAGQVFNLTTADGGTTWYAYEEYDFNPQYYPMMFWGYGGSGESGMNVGVNRVSSPVQVTGSPKWTTNFSARTNSAYGIKDNGSLWGMGYNGYGGLGQNNTVAYSSPIQIGSETNWSSVEAHDYWVNALKTDGTLWAWGYNNKGQLGVNNIAPVSSPIQVPGTSWSKLNESSSCGCVKTDGTMWLWGAGDKGELGQNNRTNYSSPVQLGSATDWLRGGGGIQNYMIKTTGQMWAMGYNGEDNTLGVPGGGGSNDHGRSSPVQVGGNDNWSRLIDHGRAHMALRTDGTLWTWGDNEFGQGGYNPTPDQTSSPKQVPGTWTAIASGNDCSIGVQSNGTLWTWGANQYGQLGHNEQGPAPTSKKPAPTQIPGTDWVGCACGGVVMYAFHEPS